MLVDSIAQLLSHIVSSSLSGVHEAGASDVDNGWHSLDDRHVNNDNVHGVRDVRSSPRNDQMLSQL